MCLFVCLVLFFSTVCFSQLQMPLRQAAQRSGIFVGTALNYGTLQSDQTYATVGGQQYNLLTAENGCKWSATEPQQNHFTFTQCDYVYNFGKSKNMTFRGHNLCWGENNPSWLTSGNFNAQQLQQILQNHITQVMSHYPENEVYCWDVVNEAVSDSPSSNNIYKTNVWYPTLSNYVNLAFQYASQVSNTKNVKLFYNDYNILMDSGFMQQKSDAVYNMIKTMKSQGIKIDGIGMQAHLQTSENPLNYNSIVSNFNRFINLGLEVHITEMDVKDSNNDQSVEAQIYQTVLRACMAVKGCKSFESWGYTDKYTWLGTSEHPLPFDENFKPKQAAYAIEQQFLNTSYPVRS